MLPLLQRATDPIPKDRRPGIDHFRTGVHSVDTIRQYETIIQPANLAGCPQQKWRFRLRRPDVMQKNLNVRTQGRDEQTTIRQCRQKLIPCRPKHRATAHDERMRLPFLILPSQQLPPLLVIRIPSRVKHANSIRNANAGLALIIEQIDTIQPAGIPEYQTTVRYAMR